MKILLVVGVLCAIRTQCMDAASVKPRFTGTALTLTIVNSYLVNATNVYITCILPCAPVLVVGDEILSVMRCCAAFSLLLLPSVTVIVCNNNNNNDVHFEEMKIGTKSLRKNKAQCDVVVGRLFCSLK